jgi:hypothetical protein
VPPYAAALSDEELDAIAGKVAASVAVPVEKYYGVHG